MQAPAAGDPHALKGKLLAEVRKRHGAPQGTMVNKGRVVWMYPAFTVYSDNGRTVSSVETTEEYKEVPIVEPAAPAAATAASPSSPDLPPAAEVPDVVVVSDRGRRVDLRAHVGKGKVTIVDFYAKWCGPCRVMAPRLEDLARDDKDVVLVKINIVSWKTDVVKQYRIASIPNLRVYDRKGQVVGKPTASLDEVRSLVAQAKKR
jgi:thioredoxin 1